MKLSDVTRVHAASILLLVFSLLNNIHVLATIPFSPSHMTTDTVSVQEKKYSAILPYIHSIQVLGYLPDKGKNVDLTDSDILQQFYLAQYTIIPTTLSPVSSQTYVLGEFHEGIDHAYLNSHHLSIIKFLGNDLYLLRHSS